MSKCSIKNDADKIDQNVMFNKYLDNRVKTKISI